MCKRVLKETIKSKINKGKAIILIGPRQVGKTTLLKTIIDTKAHLFLDGDDPTIRSLLNNPNTTQNRSIISSNKIVFIDEAQRIGGIGLRLKIIIDQFKEVQLFVSGSSSFDLSNAINDPLTGRKWEYELYPISWEELENTESYVSAEQQLENRIL